VVSCLEHFFQLKTKRTVFKQYFDSHLHSRFNFDVFVTQHLLPTILQYKQREKQARKSETLQEPSAQQIERTIQEFIMFEEISYCLRIDIHSAETQDTPNQVSETGKENPTQPTELGLVDDPLGVSSTIELTGEQLTQSEPTELETQEIEKENTHHAEDQQEDLVPSSSSSGEWETLFKYMLESCRVKFSHKLI